MIKNFEEANFTDLKRLVVAKIIPQKYINPQKSRNSLGNRFPGSDIGVLL